MATHNAHELSIQIHLNGLSFCILNTESQCVTYLKHIPFTKSLTPVDALNHIKNILSTDTAFNIAFHKVLVIYQNELATLVPTELYNADFNAEYLKYNTKILKNDFIASETLLHKSYTNVYVPYVNINNYIYDNFGTFEYKHAATILVDKALQLHQELTPAVFLNITSTSFEIVVIKNHSLLLYNNFNYATKEDFIYYVLFVYEQLQLHPNETPIILSGTILKNDALYTILYTYIKHIQFVKTDFNVTFKNYINTENLQTHYLILNAVLCE